MLRCAETRAAERLTITIYVPDPDEEDAYLPVTLKVDREEYLTLVTMGRAELEAMQCSTH